MSGSRRSPARVTGEGRGLVQGTSSGWWVVHVSELLRLLVTRCPQFTRCDLPLQGLSAHWVSSGSSSEQVLCWPVSSALDMHWTACVPTPLWGLQQLWAQEGQLLKPASAGREKGGWVGTRPRALPGGFEAPGTWETGELGLEEKRKTEARREGTKARQAESGWLGGSSLETSQENSPFAYDCNCQLTSKQRVWIVQRNYQLIFSNVKICWNFPGVSVIGLFLLMQGLWVQSLVGELRSHMPFGQKNRT